MRRGLKKRACVSVTGVLTASIFCCYNIANADAFQDTQTEYNIGDENAQIMPDETNKERVLALFNMALDFEYICDIGAYDNLGTGYEQVKGKTRLIDELLSTENMYEILLREYISYEIPEEKYVYYDEMFEQENYVELYNEFIQNEENWDLIFADARVYHTIDLLEMVLYEYAVEHDLSGEDFLQAYLDKIDQEASSDYYASVSKFELLEFMQYESTEVSACFAGVISMPAAAASAGVTVTRYTPNGIAYTCTYREETEYAEPSKYTADLVEYNGSLVSIAPKSSNCHSFAWLQKLEEDYLHLWIDTPKTFIEDGSFKLTFLDPGNIAYWGGHSAIVLFNSKYNERKNRYEPYVISKWYNGPIVSHYMAYSPYSPNSTLKVVKYYKQEGG